MEDTTARRRPLTEIKHVHEKFEAQPIRVITVDLTVSASHLKQQKHTTISADPINYPTHTQEEKHYTNRNPNQRY